MKIQIIGQIAVATFRQSEVEKYESLIADVRTNTILFFAGRVRELTDGVARKFAPLHPNFMAYYRDALMVLWQGKGKFRSGTESALAAVLSLIPKDADYLVVWRPLSEQR